MRCDIWGVKKLKRRLGRLLSGIWDWLEQDLLDFVFAANDVDAVGGEGDVHCGLDESAIDDCSGGWQHADILWCRYGDVDSTIYLLLFGVKKRKKEQADVKKEQVVYEMKWVVVSGKL